MTDRNLDPEKLQRCDVDNGGTKYKNAKPEDDHAKLLLDSNATDKDTEKNLLEIDDDIKDVVAGTEKFKFTSTFSTYMTLLGFSIGMSDFWRFPFLAYRNGGGAFLIPFVIMVILCGFPLYFLEYSVSKFSGRGPYKIWDISPLFRGIGVTIVSAYCLWMIGTTVLRCWIVDFLVNSFKNPLPWTLCTNIWNTPDCIDKLDGAQDMTNISISNSTSYLGSINDTRSLDSIPPTTFANLMNALVTNTSKGYTAEGGAASMTSEEEFWLYHVLELSSGMSDLEPIQWRHVATLAIFRVIILLGLVKSIKSIEKVIYVTATVPFFLTVAIFIQSLMQPGAKHGLYHFINPDFAKITKPRVWIEATLMAFYTLGFGWGGNTLLGSHAHFKENCLRTAIILPLANMFMATFSGLVCFSVLGNMAYAYSVDITEIINAGMSVGIVAYITALSSLPFPQIWIVFFLVAIILTGIDGQLVPMDMLMQLIGDLFPRVKSGFRLHALVVIGIVFFLCSLPTCTGAGGYIFLWMDWYNGAWVGPIVAFIQLMVVAWAYGMDRFSADVVMMIGSPIPGLLRIMTAFIAPVIVLIIFITSCMEYAPPAYGTYQYPQAARIMGWISVSIVMAPILIQAVMSMRGIKGSVWKKIKTLLQPQDDWGPCEKDFVEEYHRTKYVYKDRSMMDLFLYNLIGQYRRHVATKEENAVKLQKL